MAIFHMSVKTISRSAKRSATAAAAYRTGTLIADRRSGLEFDYTRKGGVERSPLPLLIAPSNAPEWASDRAALWNSVEETETRKNSTVAREYVVALPDELDPAARRQLARDFAQKIVDQYGCVADVAIHAPSRKGNDRNHHAHILCSTRKLEPEGFTAKTRDLDDMKTGAVTKLREVWADMVNAELERNQVAQRVDHRSHQERGLVEMGIYPTIHEGVAATAMARRGEASDRVAINDEIRAANAELLEIAAERKDLEAAIRRLIAEADRAAAAEAERAAVEAAIEARRAAAAADRAAEDEARRAAIERTWAIFAPPPDAKPVAAPAVKPPAVKPPVMKPVAVKRQASPPRDPVEAEFLGILEKKSLVEARQYLETVARRAESAEATAYGLFRERATMDFGSNGALLDKAKASHTTLTASKKVADAKLEEALAANTGWFGQKKDTAEILKMKKEITALDRDIADKAATIQKYDQLWKNEKSSLQQTADRINADREQALKYASFIEAGRKLVHQRVQQENERERSRPRERDQGVEL